MTTIYADARQVLQTVLIEQTPRAPQPSNPFIFDPSVIAQYFKPREEKRDTFFCVALKELQRNTLETLRQEAFDIVKRVIDTQNQLEENEKATLTKLKTAKTGWDRLGVASGSFSTISVTALIVWATGLTILPVTLAATAGLGIGVAVFRLFSQSKIYSQISSSEQKLSQNTQNIKNWNVLLNQLSDYETFSSYLEQFWQNDPHEFLSVLRMHEEGQ